MRHSPEPIKSRDNPMVRRLRALLARSQHDPSSCVLEGPKLLAEALAAGVAVQEVAMTPRTEATAAGRELLAALRGHGVPVRWLAEALLASLSEAETSQGVLAVARRPRFDEEALFASSSKVVVPVLVGVQNPGNVGAVLRSAEAAGATGAYLTEGTADPFSWKALRGSMGSAFRLPHTRLRTAAEALDRLKERGVRVAAALPKGAVRYDRADLRPPVAFLLGSEGAGLGDDLLARADLRLTIPMGGQVESLNVGVAAALLLFEAARQRAG